MAPSPVPMALALLSAALLSATATATRLVGEASVRRAMTSSSARTAELDFQTEDVQRAPFKADNFRLFFKRAADRTPHGSVRAVNVNTKAALGTLPHGGGSQTLVTLGPCAINQPHSHPRGTELSHIKYGELFFGFLEENFSGATQSGGRFLFAEKAEANTSIVIPQGLIHFALNRGCQEAQFIATFPDRDPGTQTTLRNLFADQVPNDVLRATTGLSDDDINKIKQKVAENPNPSVDPQCLKACGLAYR